MDPIRELGRSLLSRGRWVAGVSAIFFCGGRLPFWLGRLPRDIVHKGEHTTVYFPLMTSIVLSVGLSLLLWLIGRLRR
jgi:hypothetical protein